MKRALSRMWGWLGQPFPITRRFVIVGALILGQLGAAGIVLGAAAIDQVKTERDRAIARAQLTEDDIERIARRVVRLETPSDRAVVRQIQRALRVCVQSERCIHAVEVLADVELDRAVPLIPLHRGKPGPRSDEPPEQRNGGGDEPQRPDRPPPPTDQPAPAPPATPDPTPPTVDLDVPPIGPVDVPSICTRLVRVNC